MLTEAVRLALLSNKFQLLGERWFLKETFIFFLCADPVKNMGHILLPGLSDVVQDDTWNA